MTPVPSSIWRIGGASVTGRAHAASGQVNQDAMGWAPESGRDRIVVGAVSDGHGAPSYFRSDEGARIAVRQAMRRLEAHVQPGATTDDDDLAAMIVHDWRAEARAHLQAHPYGRMETPPMVGPPLAPYGATLLAVAVGDGSLTALQIGDGDILFGYADGRMTRPLPTDDNLRGEETYSLCQEDAEARFHWAGSWRSADAQWPDFVLLATDGVSKSYRDEAAFHDAARQLRQAAHADWAGLLADLPDWLTRLSAGGSGDDATLCLAIPDHPHTGNHSHD